MNVPNLEGASCAGFNTELFFPVTIKEEKEIRPYLEMMCNDCPVYQKCFNYAINVQVDGFWAGTMDEDRRKLREQLGIVSQSMSNDIRNLLQSDSPRAIKLRQQKEYEEVMECW
jgi:WhiB family redox-sensing transcriptional regulator